MTSPIIENMLERHALPRITADNYENFIQSNDTAVLFFCEDPNRYPESNDVAMVLPELIKEISGLAGAIVDRSYEHALQKQFDFTRWPALAFFKEGHYLGAITGIQNWEDYLIHIPEIFNREPTNAIPLVNL